RHEAPRLASNFLNVRHISKLPSRRVARFFAGNPAFAVLCFAHRQVERQLVLQVAIQLLPLEERLYPHPVAHDRLPQFTTCRQPDRSENFLSPRDFPTVSLLE